MRIEKNDSRKSRLVTGLVELGYRIGGEGKTMSAVSKKRFSCMGLAILFCAASTSAVIGANLVQNGSFEQVSSSLDFDFEGGTALTHWTTFASGSSYLDCVANPSASTATHGLCGNYSFSSTLAMDKTPVASPDGGNYVLMDADSTDETAMQQQISTSLVAGQKYTLIFFQAAGEQSGNYGTTGQNASVQWLACLQSSATATCNSTTTAGLTSENGLLSTVMTFPEKDGTLSAVGWEIQSLTFVAQTSGTNYLSFFAVGPSGAPPFAMLDGVGLYQGVPEPATFTMLGIGSLVLIGGMRRRRSK